MHTPGPWKVDPRLKARVLAGSDIVATCSGNVDGSPSANARLIAAAPRLLEALELLYLGVSTGKPLISLDSEIAAMAREAIAEAKGE